MDLNTVDGGCAMFWMDGDSRPDAAEAALDGAWQLLVELRTGFPEIRSAQAVGDLVKAARCLDRMAAKAQKVGPRLVRLPDIAEHVAAATTRLKAQPDDDAAWSMLSTLADELEEGIAHATMHRNASDDDRA